MHAFEVLAEPVRRAIVETLADGELSSGHLTDVVQARFGIAQPGVSRHLRVLRENGLVTVRADGNRRLYAINPAPLAELDEWLTPYRKLWANRLDALDTEIRRGRRKGSTR